MNGADPETATLRLSPGGRGTSLCAGCVGRRLSVKTTLITLAVIESGHTVPYCNTERISHLQVRNPE